MKEKTKTQLGKIICPRLDIQEGLEPDQVICYQGQLSQQLWFEK